MSIVAKYSNYKLGNMKIAIAVLIGLSVWCIYDGYYSQTFIDKHTEEGKADDTLMFSQKFPYIGIIGAFGVAGLFVFNKKKKLIADKDCLVLSDGLQISYDSIEEVDHTDYKKDGKFSFKYIQDGQEETVLLSDKKWDGLDKILECLISKIS